MSTNPTEELRRRSLEVARLQTVEAARLLAQAREAAVSVATRTEDLNLMGEAERLHADVQDALTALAGYRRTTPAAQPELLDADQVDETLQRGWSDFYPFAPDGGAPTRGQWGAGSYTLPDRSVLVVLRDGDGVLDTRGAGV